MLPFRGSWSLPAFSDAVAPLGVPTGALLMPAGFFLSVLGSNPQPPNRLIGLLWLGVASLTIGLLTAGIGLVIGGVEAT